jgi:hypothetical protein
MDTYGKGFFAVEKASVKDNKEKTIKEEVVVTVSKKIKNLNAEPAIKKIAGQEVTVLLGEIDRSCLGFRVMIRTKDGKESPILAKHLITDNPLLIQHGAQIAQPA